jgi:hypothetical protein
LLGATVQLRRLGQVTTCRPNIYGLMVRTRSDSNQGCFRYSLSGPGWFASTGYGKLRFSLSHQSDIAQKRPQRKVERLSHDNKKDANFRSCLALTLVCTAACRGSEESLLWEWCVYDRRRCYQRVDHGTCHEVEKDM